MHGTTLEEVLARLGELQPFDQAELLSGLTEEEARSILSHLEAAAAAEILEHMEFLHQYRLLHQMEQQAAQSILDQVSSDALVDLVMAVHPRQARQLLSLLPPEYREQIQNLMNYPENTAGGRMTIDYISVRQSMTVQEVLRHIRKVGHEAETIAYLYVVDAAGRLVGVISIRELLMNDLHARVNTFMNTSVVSVPATLDQEDVARAVSDYDLVAIPVVDQANRLLGIITVDDVIDVIHEEASEDVYRMAATSVPDNLPGRTFLQSVWDLARPRLPWLVSLLFLELGSGFIVERFSGFVSPSVAVMLALFTVVMAGESGNAATQSLAVVVRGLATGEIEARDMPRVVLREAAVGMVVGLVVGATLAVTGWLWQGSLLFGLTIGLALAANLFIAKVMGGLFPVVIHRLGIDPAVASGPFITTLTDNASMLIYYGVSALLLGHLL